LEALVNVKRLALRALRARRCNFDKAWTDAVDPQGPVLVGVDLADAVAGARWAMTQFCWRDGRPVYINIPP
jgi:hypothetical protein